MVFNTIFRNNTVRRNGSVPAGPALLSSPSQTSITEIWTQEYSMPDLIVSYRVESSPQEPGGGSPDTQVQKLERWWDFEQFVSEQLRRLEINHIQVPNCNDFDKYLRVSTQWDVELAMYCSCFSVVERIFYAIEENDSRFKRLRFVHPSGSSRFVGNPSAVLVNEKGSPVLICVVEPPWVCTSLKNFNADKFRVDQDRAVCKAIHKTLAYMRVNNLEYGVVSNYYDTRILRFMEDTVQISANLRHSAKGNCTVVGAVTAAILDAMRYAAPCDTISTTTHNVQYLQVVSPGTRQVEHVLEVKRDGSKVTTTCGKSLCRVKLADYTRANPLLQCILHETQVYSYLRSSQGTVIPKCITQGTVWGMFKVLVLENFTPVTSSELTMLHYQTMIRLVKRLHEANVCHGSITLKSFATVAGSYVTMRIVGLEFATLGPSKDQKLADIAAVKQIGKLAGLVIEQ